MVIASTGQQAEKPRSRFRRWLKWLSISGLAALLLLLIGGELFCRYHLQLGDPPLMMVDPMVGVLYKPGVYHRFGNTLSYNAYSMRSGPITPAKTDPNEIRVLMIGDSVINGGSMTDDSQLASRLLQDRLTHDLSRPVYVGNISASPWGPENELGYLKRFGLFDADVIVLVVSSHDYSDAPGFSAPVGKDPRFPSRRPVLALQELIERYCIPLPWLVGAAPDAPPVEVQANKEEHIRISLDCFKQFIAFCKAHNVPLLIAQHLTPDELNGAPEWRGHAMLCAAAREAGVEPIQLGPAFQYSVDMHEMPYRDVYIHPSPTGQKIFAQVLEPEILKTLKSRQATTMPVH